MITIHILDAIIPNILYVCSKGCGKFNLADAVKHAVRMQVEVKAAK